MADAEIASFQKEISAMGYKFQFITLAGFHTQNIAIFELAEKYKKEGMAAYSRIQEQEFLRRIISLVHLVAEQSLIFKKPQR